MFCMFLYVDRLREECFVPVWTESGPFQAPCWEGKSKIGYFDLVSVPEKAGWLGEQLITSLVCNTYFAECVRWKQSWQKASCNLSLLMRTFDSSLSWAWVVGEYNNTEKPNRCHRGIHKYVLLGGIVASKWLQAWLMKRILPQKQ